MHYIEKYEVLSKIIRTREVIDYGVKMIGAEYEWQETQGEGVKVGIIDTGIDLNHVDLKNRIKKSVSFIDDDVNDLNGHGTHVAGVVAAEKNGVGVVGVAPKCDLYIAKAFDERGVSNDVSIIKSLEWMLENRVNIINMSYSSNKIDEKEKALLEECSKNGIILSAAAGNSGGHGNQDTISYPARYENVIAVTAVDYKGDITDFSSVGEKAQVAAAGKNILSCYKNNSYAVLSGTSMATPLITGAIAILQAKAMLRFNRYLNPDEINTLVAMYADYPGMYGKSSRYGYGIFSFGRIQK
ncbi:MAG: S8 family peptidase [Clostridia bacterium]|nr:S8 family peptidase [Clostridia bacterium]